MAEAARKLATYADLEALPDNVTGELIGGTLHALPRPAGRHAMVAMAVAGKVHGDHDHASGGGWWILPEPELHLGPDVLVPDIAGWRRERLPDPWNHVAFSIAPDWVCEVLSPSTGTRDRTIKRDLYAQHCVGHLWLIDPGSYSLEAFRLENSHWTLVKSASGNQHVRVEPFEATEINLLDLWPDFVPDPE